MADDGADVFANEVRPFLFDGIDTGQEAPEFTLLLGEPGSGRSRTVGRLLEAGDGRVVVLRAADLRPFLRDTDGVEQLRKWMAEALDIAREQRVSVILEDQFQKPHDATSILDRFASSGFASRIVATAVPHAEAVLAVAAREARRSRPDHARMDLGDRPTERRMQFVESIFSAASSTTTSTVVRRDGTTESVSTAQQTLQLWRDAREAPLPGRAAAEWISELRRLREQLGAPSSPKSTEALIELHRLALADVIPRLPLTATSVARERLEARVRRDLALLQHRATEDPGALRMVGGAADPQSPDAH